jgi:MarR family
MFTIALVIGEGADTARHWGFLSNHFLVLFCVARNPDARVRDIAEAVDITERTAQSILKDLSDASYLERTRLGRRSHYEIRRDLPLPDSMVAEHPVSTLLDALRAGPAGSSPKRRLVY